MKLKNNPTLKSYKIRVGITIGDPAGIGPAITLKAIRYLRGLARFVVIGDEWVFNQVSSIRYQASDVEFIDMNNVSQRNFEFGKIRAEYGRASIEYLDKALELIRNKQIDCLVTCPISKEAINLAGLKYCGHTEYFSYWAHKKDLGMMLLNKELRISLATRHIPLKKVPFTLTQERLNRTILLTYKSLKAIFSIKKPRLIVCGLNPHASDNGTIGNEENRIIKPVLKKLKRQISSIEGPISADVAIHMASQNQYDCVIAMYHDQALIPLKLLDDETGVNMTLGLPFIRTSPLHGTAFDIAKDPHLANPASLIEAIKLAVRCTLNLKKA